MTDAHTHVVRGGATHFLCEPFAGGATAAQTAPGGTMLFFGCHPWAAAEYDEGALRAKLAANPRAGVGETGLDRLRDKTIGDGQRAAFASQLRLAAEFRRPVSLHGAKCWGEVVAACREFAGAIPAFVFHGFSRSAGLVDAMRAMGGFISVGPAVLNSRAVNYRELVKSLPDDAILVETDATDDTAPAIEEVAAAAAALRGVPPDAFEALTDANAGRILSLF